MVSDSGWHETMTQHSGVVFVQAANECIMYESCMYHECITDVSSI